MLQTNIMRTEQGPKVLGYKANFGEIEAAAVIPLLSWDSNLEEIMMACVQGRLIDPHTLGAIKIGVESRTSAVVVLTEARIAKAGFPRNIRKTLPIYINRRSESTSKYIIIALLQFAKSKVNMLADLDGRGSLGRGFQIFSRRCLPRKLFEQATDHGK